MYLFNLIKKNMTANLLILLNLLQIVIFGLIISLKEYSTPKMAIY